MRSASRSRKPPTLSPFEEASNNLSKARSQFQAARDRLSTAVTKVKSIKDARTPAHSSLGRPLQLSWTPYAPPDQSLVALKIEVDGFALTPPSDRFYQDHILWNMADEQFTPEAFAARTCDDENLPPQFAEGIVKSIRREINNHEKALARNAEMFEDEERPEVTPVTVVTECRGITFKDQLLWSNGITPEEYARSLGEDLGLPSDLCLAASLALRHELQEQLLDTGSYVAEPPSKILRSASDAADWTPVIKPVGQSKSSKS